MEILPVSVFCIILDIVLMRMFISQMPIDTIILI
jgi:hypothetical protein